MNMSESFIIPTSFFSLKLQSHSCLFIFNKFRLYPYDLNLAAGPEAPSAQDSPMTRQYANSRKTVDIMRLTTVMGAASLTN